MCMKERKGPITTLIAEINQLRLHERDDDQRQRELAELRASLAKALLGQVAH